VIHRRKPVGVQLDNVLQNVFGAGAGKIIAWTDNSPG
jgi:hypothetical protein